MDLTPAEQQFFATGELPESLAADAFAPPPATPAAETPPVVPPAAAPAVVDPTAELRAQLESERARRGVLEANFARLAERLPLPDAAAPPPPVVEPDQTVDPLGSMMHKLRVVTETVTAMQQTLTQQQQQSQQQAQFNEFQQNLQQIRTEFTKTQPDFPAAYTHLRTQRAEDLRDVGVPEARINEALLRDEIAATQNAIAQGKNPAQVMYNMAKRYGYTGKAGVQATAASTAAERIAALKVGTNADPAPARADSTSQLTFEALKDAGDADLNKMVQDDKLWSSLVGNRNHNIF